MIYIAPPHGDFFIEAEAETPITLISAGVGQTPILSMLHALHDSQHQAEIHWLHAAETVPFTPLPAKWQISPGACRI